MTSPSHQFKNNRLNWLKLLYSRRLPLMASVVKVAFGRLKFSRPYATDQPGQLRLSQLFRVRGKTPLRLGPVPRPHVISGNRRRQ